MKVWITKYALTRGIIEADGTICHDVSVDMIAVSQYEYYHKPYWHTSRDEAVSHAESIRVRKVASIQKQITRLEKLSFCPPKATGGDNA